MRVLVTGHAGYIGSVLAPFLAACGHDVVGLDAELFHGCDFGVEPEVIRGRVADVRDVVPSDLAGVDAIVHLAALSNDPLGDLDPGMTRNVNCDGTLRLARAAREAGVRRFVFASSCSMYGASGTDEALDESAPLRPLTAYAESKVRAEEGLFALAAPDFAPVSMRNGTAFGASPRLRLDIVLNNLAAWAHTTGRIRLLSDGTAWRPLVHVRDIAKAALTLLEAPEDRIRGEAFNVGTDGQNYRVRRLAEILATVTGCAIEIADGSSADQRSYRVDFSKLARTFPDLVFDWDAERGARELVDAYRTVDLRWEDFDGDRYVRIRRLLSLRDAGKLDGELRWQLPVAS
jgi:nucleoside-diphosphate-sugar epimerase